jgi:hypothetical protein
VSSGAVAALVVAALAAPLATALAKDSGRPETFQYYDCRIQLQVPPGWKVEPRRDHFIEITLSPTAGVGRIGIAYYQPLNDRGFQDFKVWARYHLKRSGASKVRFRTINGSPAFTATSPGQWPGWKIVETDIGWQGPLGGEVFVVLLDDFNEKTSPSLLGDYEKIVSSVKITPSPRPVR